MSGINPSPIFNPHDWYWHLPDEQVFSSQRGAAVSVTDETYQAFLDAGNFTSTCPDDTGALTVVAVTDMLTEHYGVGAKKEGSA